MELTKNDWLKIGTVGTIGAIIVLGSIYGISYVIIKLAEIFSNIQ